MLQAGLVVQAVLEGLSLAAGRRPPELATHLSYLVASLLLLPLFAAVQRDGRDLDGRGLDGRDRDARDRGGRSPGSVMESVACAAVAVVTMRLQATAGVPHA